MCKSHRHTCVNPPTLQAWLTHRPSVRGRTNWAAYTHTHAHGFGLLGYDCSRLVEGSTANIAGVAQRKKWKLDPAHAPEFDTERHTGGEGLHRCRCLPASKLQGAGDGAPEFQHVLSRSATRSRSQSGPAWVAYTECALHLYADVFDCRK